MIDNNKQRRLKIDAYNTTTGNRAHTTDNFHVNQLADNSEGRKVTDGRVSKEMIKTALSSSNLISTTSPLTEESFKASQKAKKVFNALINTFMVSFGALATLAFVASATVAAAPIAILGGILLALIATEICHRRNQKNISSLINSLTEQNTAKQPPYQKCFHSLKLTNTEDLNNAAEALTTLFKELKKAGIEEILPSHGF